MESPKPRLTIVIPVYNRRKEIIRVLESARRQTLRPLRIIVADNGSGDGTPEAAEEWIRSNADSLLDVRLLHEPEKGAWKARASGEREADTEFISFFDSDDEMLPGYASSIVEGFDRNPSADLLIWSRIYKYDDGRIRRPAFIRRRPVANQAVHSTICSETFAARTPFFLSAGKWENAAVPVWDDWVLGMKMLLCKPGIAFLDCHLGIIHAHGDSITGDSFSPKAGLWETAVENVREYGKRLSPRARKRLDFLLDYKLAVLAGHYRREGNAAASQKIMKSLENMPLSPVQRAALKFACRYTAAGLRGCARILSPLLREP